MKNGENSEQMFFGARVFAPQKTFAKLCRNPIELVLKYLLVSIDYKL